MDKHIDEIIKSTRNKFCYYLHILNIEKFMNLNIVSVIVILTIYKLINVIIF